MKKAILVSSSIVTVLFGSIATAQAVPSVAQAPAPAQSEPLDITD